MDQELENQIIPLAEGFEEASREDWTALVETALKGRPFDKALNTPTYEGVTLRPLYRGDDDPGERDPAGFPGAMPFTRGLAAVERNRRGWDIRQAHEHPDPGAANADIKADLSGGARSVVLRLGDEGILVRTLADLDTALDGVDLAQVGIALRPAGEALPAAATLVALARRRGVALTALSGTFGADPLGTLAEDGVLPGPIERQMAAAAALAEWSGRNAPGMRAIWIDTASHHAAGATETQDLAFATATAVAYLRALTDFGLDIDTACRQIGFTLSVGTDVFQVIAKLRAARRLWARVAEACGAGEAARGMALGATTAKRMVSRREIWVNQLRATCACFAAGTGGADSITVRPYTDALGLPEPFARRVARNVQTILVQESSLARVADPAGGSYYVEQLTAEYARRAWALFQEIEAGGGMTEALLSGRISEMLQHSWAERERNLARRRDQVTGVSSFPDIDETPDTVVRSDPESLELAAERARAGDMISVPDDLDVERLIAAAGNGASFKALSEPLRGDVVRVPALERHRLGEAFEALRDASDLWLAERGRRPAVFVARLGTPVDYTARTVFAKSYFAASGIAAIEIDVDGNSAGAAFRESGAELAVICSSDTLYASAGEAVARALKEGGAGTVILAGRPGEREATFRAAGIDRFIHAGDDMLAMLRRLAGEIGMIG